MSSRRRSLRWILGILTLLSGSSLLHSQPSLTELKEKLDRGVYREVLAKLLKGDITADPNNPDHVGAISTETEWIARSFVDSYYLNTPPNPPDKDKNKTLAYLIGRVDVDIKQMTGSRNDIRPVAALYTHYFALHAKNVILKDEKRNPMSSLNLTRALTNLAVLGQGELSEALVEIIDADLAKDKIPEAQRLKEPENLPNDGVKYYALRGLRDLLAQQPKPDMPPILTKDQELKVVKLLQKAITTTQTFKDGTSPHEIDGFRVRRREAVKALAQITNPVLPDKKDGAAMTLLRVMARDSALTPEPSIDERLEAAVGLAKMKFEPEKDYNPDYAAFHIGLFLDDFVVFCNTDDGNKKYQRPVRVYASRLIEGLESLNVQIADEAIKRTPEEKAFVNQALFQYLKVLTELEKATDSKVNPTNYKLKTWISSAKVPNTQLFKAVAGTAVTPLEKKN